MSEFFPFLRDLKELEIFPVGKNKLSILFIVIVILPDHFMHFVDVHDIIHTSASALSDGLMMNIYDGSN